VSLLRSFQADSIISVDSSLFLRALAPYGKALSHSDRLFLCLLGDRVQDVGIRSGVMWFYAGFDFLAGFVTETESLRSELSDRYQLGPADHARIHVFRAPVDQSPAASAAPSDPAASSEPAGRPVVAWAGRSGRHGRPEIVVEVARRLPEVDFHVWGDAEDFRAGPEASLPDNLRLEDAADHQVADLESDGVDAWLHTSSGEGTVDRLLDLAMTGLPVVGDVRELHDGDQAAMAPEWQSADAFESTLREVLADLPGSRAQAQALRDRLIRERTPAALGEYAAALLLTSTERDGGQDD